MATRKLSLHASALNDEEYILYTQSLDDIALVEDIQGAKVDEHYERMAVGIREVRAWLRGRYSHVPGSQIDTILKYFSPTMKQGDTLSGGEFFAAIRLVIHAEHGKEVERALAFVQAHPTPSRPQSRNETPIKKHSDLLPPPSRRPTVDSSIYSATSTTRFSSTSEPPPRSASPPKRHPPPPTHHPPLHPSQHAEPPKPILQHANHNPFLQRLPDTSSRLPPLPPRKPPPPPVPSSSHVYLAPPRHGARSTSPSSSGAETPTVVFPKPASHVTSALIKQSLQASKAAQSMKKAEEQLEKERVMQVLKSSSVVSGSHSFAGANGILGSSVVIGTSIHNRGHSPVKDDPPMSVHSAPPLPRRRHHYQQQPSPPMSTSSLEQVALATTGVHPDSPSRLNLDLPPPQHPDRKPPSTASSNIESFEAVYGANTSTTTLTTTTEDSPTARVFRSKSLHQPSPPRPPLPPPLRRKRPESVQMVSSGEALFTASVRDRSVSRHTSLSSPTPTVAHRRSSLSVSGASASSSPYPSTPHDPLPHMSNIQRTIANLQPRLDALRFDGSKARYKAEAGLSRRGFVRDSSRGREDQEGLMPSSGEDAGVDSAVEDEDGFWKEKDNLKWPAGEGWKPL